MALADSVPGVSGGTIAFVMGFYDKFINSLQSLVSRKSTKEEKKDSLIFLIKIGIGWVIGLLLAVKFISSVFEKNIYSISSLFVGLIVFAIPIILKEEKETIKNKSKYLIFTVVGIIVVGLITYFNPASGSEGINLAIDKLNFGLILYVFIVGMIAISAMVLPGISGSTLLLIFGLYAPIINAVEELLKLNFTYVPILIVFGLGVITGIISVIKLISYVLKNYRAQTIYLILGLMIGSIYAVFMGPTTLENPVSPMGIKTFSILFFIIGGAIMIGLERLKVYLENK